MKRRLKIFNLENNNKIFGLRRNVFFLGLVSLFNDFSNEMIQSVMPSLLFVTFGVSPLGIGLIEGVSDALASFLKIFSGWFSDMIGRRKIPAVVGYVLSVCTRPFFILASNFYHVFTIRLVDRIGKGLRDAPRDALLASSVAPEELGKSFGYHRAMDAAGGVLGPLAAFLILPVILNDYKKLFLIAFAVGILAVLSFFFVKEVPAMPQKPNGSLVRLDLGLLRANWRFALFLGAIFIFGLGTIPITLMFLRPIGLGFGLASIPIAYFIYNITFVLTAIPLGRLSDKIGERKVIAGGFVAAIASYLVLAFSNSVAYVVLAIVCFGIYAAATEGVKRALAAKLVDPRLLATGEGLLHASAGLSSLIAGIVSGLLWSSFGHSAAFIYGAAMSILGLIVFYLISFNGFIKHRIENRISAR